MQRRAEPVAERPEDVPAQADGRGDQEQQPRVLGQHGRGRTEERTSHEAGGSVQEECEEALACGGGIGAEQAHQAASGGAEVMRRKGSAEGHCDGSAGGVLTGTAP